MAAAIASRSWADSCENHPEQAAPLATKIPPKNFKWPTRRGFTLDDCFPPDHIREYAEKSLANLGVATIDLQQFHVWEDAWAHDERWQRAVDDLKRQGLIRAVGVSINRWEPANVLETLKTGLIDAVQVIYNIFDQAPEDELFPLCRERQHRRHRARALRRGDAHRHAHQADALARGRLAEHLFRPREPVRPASTAPRPSGPLVPPGMTMPELALRWILEEPTVSTIIPGMRRSRHVEANLDVSDGKRLDAGLMRQLKAHRWDRTPTKWSQ